MRRSALALLVACAHHAPAPTCPTTTGDWVCELPDRVVLVSQFRAGAPITGEVTSIPRRGPPMRAPLLPTSSCTDPCDDDGYAGCSMKETCTLDSSIATITT